MQTFRDLERWNLAVGICLVEQCSKNAENAVGLLVVEMFLVILSTGYIVALVGDNKRH